VQTRNRAPRALGEVRVDPAGQDAIYLDVVAGPGGGETLGELHDAAFGGGVRGGHVQAEDAGHRADRDDFAAAASFELWIDRVTAGEDTGQVGVDDVGPFLQRVRLGALADGRARVGNQDVDTAQRVGGLADHVFDLGGHGDVDVHRHGFDAERG